MRVVVGLVVVLLLSGCGPAVQEDEPGWDCRSMGNRVCGPGVV